jgi:hypothetical protein
LLVAVAVAVVGVVELLFPAVQKAVAVVVAVPGSMVVALVLVAQRFTQMAVAPVPALPVPQVLQLQAVLGAQEISFPANPLNMVVQGVQGAVLDRLVLRAKVAVSVALDPVVVVGVGAITLLETHLPLGLLQVHGLAVLLNEYALHENL